MIYVALLRGINVGGNNKVDMKPLKATFERLGLKDVKTYINSGNVIFRDDAHKPNELIAHLEKAIAEDFGFVIKVLVRDIDNIAAVANALPDSWTNDANMRCDVMFLWEAVDNPTVLKQIIIKPGMDDVKYVPGAILWRVDRANVTRSGMMKLVSTELYKKVTIRNSNTLRKLAALMQAL